MCLRFCGGVCSERMKGMYMICVLDWERADFQECGKSESSYR